MVEACPRTAATRMPGRSTSAALPSAEPPGTSYKLPMWPSDHLVGTSPHSGTVAGFVGSDTWITKYLSGCSMLALREMACNALGGS